jgi:hypothetical protein
MTKEIVLHNKTVNVAHKKDNIQEEKVGVITDAH